MRESGVYGWAVILLLEETKELRFYFRPVAPSDQLKMRPWGTPAERKLYRR